MSVDLIDFLESPEPEYDFIVDGVLESQDRIGLSGPEGYGKSTLLKQFGVQCAIGEHPFRGDDIAPIRVLCIDFENSGRQNRRAFKTLQTVAQDRLKPDMFFVEQRPEGIDLQRKEDERWLNDVVAECRPKLVTIGPVYKMSSGDPDKEMFAKVVTDAIDRLRVRHECAVMLEMHVGHGQQGGRRPSRPTGSSVWLRWPEFGLHLHEDGKLTHWRGQRDERDWPTALKRGGEWPWTVERDMRAVTFARMLDECRSAAKVFSIRELAGRIDAPKSQVERAIKANERQWHALVAEIES